MAEKSMRSALAAVAGLAIVGGATSVLMLKTPDEACVYCTKFNPQTRMMMWVDKPWSGCEPGWQESSDKIGAPCNSVVVPTATQPSLQIPTPLSTKTPTPGLTLTPTPGAAIPYVAFSLSLPADGYVVKITCPPGACWIDGRTADWKLTGPWKLTMEAVTP